MLGRSKRKICKVQRAPNLAEENVAGFFILKYVEGLVATKKNKTNVKRN